MRTQPTPSLLILQLSSHQFENVGVGTTNKGYLLIGSEIIEYDNVSGSNIGGNIVRGSNPINYPVGTPVYKYENSGVNLQRINKTHDLNNVTVANPITFDSYNVKLDMTALDSANDDRSNDVGFPALYLSNTKSTGVIIFRLLKTFLSRLLHQSFRM